ncbi:hypothetical protein KIPB_004882 [Kipferlia bialata]|uniref:Uncharacterized protein n=1 Tax=Kipferlia bialata TaxID=797122 RepID=A0A9K3CW70_9EUKA|nr:hypothetical protein KIPB_004882 [Kipferlia bialata]|eukprot:g4882.t1
MQLTDEVLIDIAVAVVIILVLEFILAYFAHTRTTPVTDLEAKIATLNEQLREAQAAKDDETIERLEGELKDEEEALNVLKASPGLAAGGQPKTGIMMLNLFGNFGLQYYFKTFKQRSVLFSLPPGSVSGIVATVLKFGAKEAVEGDISVFFFTFVTRRMVKKLAKKVLPPAQKKMGFKEKLAAAMEQQKALAAQSMGAETPAAPAQ